jgi:hypothetical protein
MCGVKRLLKWETRWQAAARRKDSRSLDPIPATCRALHRQNTVLTVSKEYCLLKG